MLRTSSPLLPCQRRNASCYLYLCKKGVAISATPFFFGVPKGIPFDTAQDKLTPVIPMKIGMSLAEKKTPINSGPPGLAWRPQGDSNPCYRRERPVSLASRRWGPELNGMMEYWNNEQKKLNRTNLDYLKPIIPLFQFSNWVYGGPCGTRTHDSLLKRQILYLLS